jgi:hypothetical protein
MVSAAHMFIRGKWRNGAAGVKPGRKDIGADRSNVEAGTRLSLPFPAALQ